VEFLEYERENEVVWARNCGYDASEHILNLESLLVDTLDLARSIPQA
jgi:hypothetical protein